MQKLYTIISFLYLILLLVFGLIPKTMAQMAYVAEILLFLIFTAIMSGQIRKCFCRTPGGRRTIECLMLLVLLSLVFLVLSFRNFADYWGLYNLAYNPLYIPRHYFIIVQFFISIGLGFCLYKSKAIIQFKSWWALVFLIFVLIVTGVRFGENARTYTSLIVAFLSFLCLRRKVFLVFLPLVGMLFTDSSTYVIAIFLLIVMMVCQRQISAYLQKNGFKKLLVLFLIGLVTMIVFSATISDEVEADGNAAWRLTVWKNELALLAKTYYTGVGFGTAYVSTDIIKQTTNIDMYMKTDGGFMDGIFLVANHSSLVNMFYRMGLAGGMLFVLFNLYLLNWCISINRRSAKMKKNRYLWWAMSNYVFNFIVILFNPGLEMMQFSVGYQLSLAILFAVLFSALNQDRTHIAEEPSADAIPQNANQVEVAAIGRE